MHIYLLLSAEDPAWKLFYVFVIYEDPIWKLYIYCFQCGNIWLKQFFLTQPYMLISIDFTGALGQPAAAIYCVPKTEKEIENGHNGKVNYSNPSVSLC